MSNETKFSPSGFWRVNQNKTKQQKQNLNERTLYLQMPGLYLTSQHCGSGIYSSGPSGGFSLFPPILTLPRPHPGLPIRVLEGSQDRLEIDDLAPKWPGLQEVFPTTPRHTNCVWVPETGQTPASFTHSLPRPSEHSTQALSSPPARRWADVTHEQLPAPSLRDRFVPVSQHSSCAAWYLCTCLVLPTLLDGRNVSGYAAHCRARALHSDKCGLCPWMKRPSLCSEHQDVLFGDTPEAQLQGLCSLLTRRPTQQSKCLYQHSFVFPLNWLPDLLFKGCTDLASTLRKRVWASLPDSLRKGAEHTLSLW